MSKYIKEKHLRKATGLKGFYEVPRMSGVFINRDGKVITTIHGYMETKIYGGYPCVNLPGSFTIGVYRLLAMTFLICPGNFEDYVVNHIDGVKLNISLENLEWVTYTENNVHAFKAGLRSDVSPLKVFDLDSDEVTSYYSLSECARQLGVNNALLWTILRSKIPKAILGRYLVVRESDDFPTSFVMYRHAPKRPNYTLAFKRKKVPIKVTDVETNEEKIWDSADAFALSRGAKPSTVRKSIYLKGRWKNFKIEYIGNN